MRFFTLGENTPTEAYTHLNPFFLVAMPIGRIVKLQTVSVVPQNRENSNSSSR